MLVQITFHGLLCVKLNKRRNQLEAVLANALSVYVVSVLDRTQRSSADAITNAGAEPIADAHANSIDAGTTAQPANNF